MISPDWAAGLKPEQARDAKSVRGAALVALKRASEWADTAERLLAKADDLERKEAP